MKAFVHQKHSTLIIAFFAMYVFNNLLFAAKYMPRAGFGPFAGPIVYLVLCSAFLALVWFSGNRKWSFLNDNFWRHAYRVMSILVPLASLVLLMTIDKTALRVDRWSAIEGFLEKLYSGDYPYTAESHLGQATSPMPTIHLISIPFYLFGDVGYLQIAVFVAFATAVSYAVPGSNYSRSSILLLLAAAPAFWWEIVARSDLMSTMTFTVILLILVDHGNNARILKRPVLVGIPVGLLLATRGIVVIPLILYFFPKLFSTSFRDGAVFIAVSIVSFSVVILPFVLWDPELFMQYNPLIQQTNKTPTFVQVTAILLSFFFSFRVNELWQVFFSAGSILFGIMLFTLLYTIRDVGFHNAFYGSLFDISYFNSALPFLLVSFGLLNVHREKRPDASPAENS